MGKKLFMAMERTYPLKFCDCFGRDFVNQVLRIHILFAPTCCPPAGERSSSALSLQLKSSPSTIKVSKNSSISKSLVFISDLHN